VFRCGETGALIHLYSGFLCPVKGPEAERWAPLPRNKPKPSKKQLTTPNKKVFEGLESYPTHKRARVPSNAVDELEWARHCARPLCLATGGALPRFPAEGAPTSRCALWAL
jgi:hypothetical protein